nr:immunoglobulin light chain junction region [Macaca mulatta]
CQHYYSSPCSV